MAPQSSPLPPVLSRVSLACSAASSDPPPLALSFFDALHAASASSAPPSSATEKTRFAIPCSPVRRLCLTLTSRLRPKGVACKRENGGRRGGAASCRHPGLDPGP